MEFQREEGRIYAMDNGELMAEITFPSIDEHTVNINHTFVHPNLRGQHIAASLMEAVVEELRKQNKQCIATCSYAKGWFEKHPDVKEELIRG